MKWWPVQAIGVLYSMSYLSCLICGKTDHSSMWPSLTCIRGRGLVSILQRFCCFWFVIASFRE